MSEKREPADLFWGTALNGAVRVSVDEHGKVVAVRLDQNIVRRLWPEQLGRGVVAAHAAARAAATATVTGG